MKRQSILVLVTTTFLFFPIALQNVEATMYFIDGKTHIVDFTISENVVVAENFWGEPTSVILVSGGSIEGELYSSVNSQIDIWGGSILDNLYSQDNGQINIYGGLIDGNLYTFGNSQITISGGSFGGEFIPWRDDSVLTIVGSGFAIDGSPVGYGELSSILGGHPYFEPYRTLTGILANGDLINNQFRIGDDAKIVLTPVPSAVILGGLGMVVASWRLRRMKRSNEEVT